MENNLKKKIETVFEDGINRHTVSSFFILIREVVKKDIENYPLIYIYSNWVAHLELDSNKKVRKILEEMEAEIFKRGKNAKEIMYNFVNGNGNGMSSDVYDFISLVKLETELKDFSKKYNICLEGVVSQDLFFDSLLDWLEDHSMSIERNSLIKSFSIVKRTHDKVKISFCIKIEDELGSFSIYSSLWRNI